MKNIILLFLLISLTGSSQVSKSTEQWLIDLDNKMNDVCDFNQPSCLTHANTLDNNGSLQEHYFLRYYVEGYIRAWQATGDIKYLNQVKTWMDNVMATAVPVDFNASYLGWPAHPTLNGYDAFARGNGYSLWESHLWSEVAYLLKVLYRNQAFLDANPTYQTWYNDTLAFIQLNLWDKWEAVGLQQFERVNTYMASHWARIGMELHIITGTTKYKTVFDNWAFDGMVNQGNHFFRERIYNVTGGTSHYANWTGTEPSDVSHSGPIMQTIAEAVKEGYYFVDADITGFKNLLENVIWPTGGAGGALAKSYQNLDGTGGTELSGRLGEWAIFGQYSQTLNNRFAVDYFDVSDAQYNSVFYAAVPYGWGAYNQATLDDDVVYKSEPSVVPPVYGDIESYNELDAASLTSETNSIGDWVQTLAAATAITVEPTIVNTGSYSLKLFNNSGSGTVKTGAKNTITVVAGETYTYSAYLRKDGNADPVFTIKGAGVVGGVDITETLTTTNAFEQVTGTFVTSGTSVEIWVETGFTYAGTVYVDDFSLTYTNAAPTITSKTDLLADTYNYLFVNPLPAFAGDPDQTDYLGEHERNMRIAEFGDSAGFFAMYALESYMPPFEAGGSKVYLDSMLVITHAIMDTAAPSSTLNQTGGYNDAFLSWTHILGEGYQNASRDTGQQQLYEVERFKEIIRMIWVLHHSPNLRGEATILNGQTYQQHYDEIKTFFIENFWNKWSARLSNKMYVNSGLNSSASWGFVAWHLWDITGEAKYKDILDKLNYNVEYTTYTKQWNGMTDAIVPNDANVNALQWDTSWGGENNTNPYQGRDIMDHGHGTFVVNYLVNDYQYGQGIWDLTIMDKLVNTVSVFWPDGEPYDRIYYWLDAVPTATSVFGGTSDPNDTSTENDSRNGLPGGWIELGRFDEPLQERYATMSPTYFISNRTASVHYAQLSKNRAIMDGTVQYPEQFITLPTLPTLPTLKRRKQKEVQIFRLIRNRF
tara:strand:- start:11060 stop:14020 length:2961 start_codon:yes stop_codon:yes gene_type:complete